MVTRGMGAAAMAALCVALAGCSSGSSDGGVPPAERYDARTAEGTSIADEMYYEVYSDPASLPTSGSASYDGVIGLVTNGLVANDAPEEYDIQGDLSLLMDFDDASDPISGEATGFVSDDEEFGGHLVVSDSDLSRNADMVTEAPFAFALDGTLTAPDGEDLGIALDAVGAFSGDDVDEFDHAFGAVFGAGCDAVGCTDVEGSFVTRRSE